MPVITVQIHPTETAVKAALIRNLTTAATETTKVPAEKFTVYIQEFGTDNIGVGGKTLTEVRASR